MKTIKMISMALLFGLFMSVSTNVHAQDPIKVASNVYKKVILENEKLRVMQVELAPGEIVPWHSHPDHFAYALTDGKLEITEKGKPAVIADIKEGEAMYLTATTHMAKNIGENTLKMIVTELKAAKTKH
ncbi:Cupin domain-containing protein [Pedobacter steynii]|uniref:Cupin domain-containing protein n=1 Tax=Pedobacter steynii TaxID=430522 RepID=A0A1G9RHG8_9SPHI|nr:cupin domain-containing protein [Pedobacter steynii]NQX37755.1 cupin domain-containing protein [Pedobacter steynii]SDM22643.1 Cupin domain-containing protein [Pedobacter steynii]